MQAHHPYGGDGSSDLMEDPILSEMLFGSLKSAGKGPSAWG
jgi:hypothetical protein